MLLYVYVLRGGIANFDFCWNLEVYMSKYDIIRRRLKRLLLLNWVCCYAVVFLIFAITTSATQFTNVFQLGSDDSDSDDFGEPDYLTTFGNGSPTNRDDHYYFAGNYPSGVGFVPVDEPVSNLERTIECEDPSSTLHFNLNSNQISSFSRMRLKMDLFDGTRWFNGHAGPGFGTRDVGVYFNEIQIASASGITRSHLFDITFSADSVNADATGGNTIRMSKIGGPLTSWIEIDYITLSVDTNGLADGDGDTIPLWWEELYGFDDNLAADAVADGDSDGRSNLEEFNAGTSPVTADSDHDGLTDGEEAVAGTDPLDSDTDNDTLSDGSETTSSPVLADSDADGAPDPMEISAGTDPQDDGSTPLLFGGAVGLNFSTIIRPEIVIEQYEQTGVFPQMFWNNTQPLSHNTDASGSLSNLTNSAGNLSGISVTWSASNSWYSRNTGTPDQKIWAGYLESEGGFTGSHAQVTLGNLPAGTYDMYVYVGAYENSSTGAVRLNSNPSNDRYYITSVAPPFIRFGEAVANVESNAALSNYVRFRNVSGPNITVENAAINDDVGIHAVQLVNVSQDTDGDTIPDYYELANGLDPHTNDAASDADDDGLDNLAEFNAETDPNNPDTDNDQLLDGDEAANGANPLLSDTDGDGILDGVEVNANPFSTRPDLADTDGDGESDYAELLAHTDPTDIDITTSNATVPVWDPGNHRWVWAIDNVTVVINHDISLMTLNYGGRDTFFRNRIELKSAGSADDLRMGICCENGSITFRNVCQNNVFYFNNNPNDSWYDSGPGNPPPDLASTYGFSMKGEFDTSYPLRFVFTAQEDTPTLPLTWGSESNTWILSFDVYNQTDTNVPVLINSSSRSNVMSISTEVRTGTAVWTDGETDDTMFMDMNEGITAFISREDFGPADNDNDGMPDYWETTYGGDLAPGDDPDGDGVLNVDEFLAGTRPDLADTDGDGALDNVELAHGSDPNDIQSVPPFFNYTPNTFIEDLNSNGLSDVWELWAGDFGLNGADDSDGDRVSNEDESIAGTDPFDSESFNYVLINRNEDDLIIEWPEIYSKSFALYLSDNLFDWFSTNGLPPPVSSNGMLRQTLTEEIIGTSKFYRVITADMDTDSDGLTDWAEEQVLGSESDNSGDGTADSLGQSLTNHNGTLLSGDFLSFLGSMYGSSASGGLPQNDSSNTPSAKAASRFLIQATFGSTLLETARIQSMGYEAWIDDQLTVPPTLHSDYIRAIKADHNGPRAIHSYIADSESGTVYGENQTTSFARAAVMGEDQLRQRMAFALSQILVTSRADASLDNIPEAMSDYYDIFVRHGFGSYRDILMEAAMHPCMGVYLSHVGNQKADVSIGRYPDENFAREIMQLFTVGLWMLNPDGTRTTDGYGEPIPTYGNAEITELARVFTGLWFDSENGWGSGGWRDHHFMRPMVMHSSRHDFEAKVLLNGYVIPTRYECEENGYKDIEDAVNHLFNHPNTPVFISKQLIQFFVTSNPSTGYVQRVQSVFVDNGQGVRGDLGAVIKTILLDIEAREAEYAVTDTHFGKLREPVIRTMALARAFDISIDNPDFVWWNSSEAYYGRTFQEPTLAPSVFNFYKPSYQSPVIIRDAALVSPVFQILDSYSSIALPNLMWEYIVEGLDSGWGYLNYPFNFSEARKAAATNAALLDHMNLLLAGGKMSAHTRSIILDALDSPELIEDERIKLAAYLTLMSPEGAIQR